MEQVEQVKEEVMPEKRKRGRPRKNPLPVDAVPAVPKKRGRPRKETSINNAVEPAEAESAPAVDITAKFISDSKAYRLDIEFAIVELARALNGSDEMNRAHLESAMCFIEKWTKEENVNA